MCWLDMQQRFAEGLATHLTSGAEVGNGANNHYGDLLASLPADPAMAGLLEPLVLPADAYQIPAETHQLLAAHPLNQEASADQHQPLLQMHQSTSDPARALESSSALSGPSPVRSLPGHAPASMQSVANQQRSADQPTHPAGMLGLQQGIVSCHSLHHAGDAGAPYPQKLQQSGWHDELQAASMRVHTETVPQPTLPVQQSVSTLCAPVATSQSVVQQGTASAQQAAGCCGLGKASSSSQELLNPGPHQLQGLPSASTCLPVCNQVSEEGQAQQLVGRGIGGDEAAALDSLYATIFPHRHTANPITGKSKHVVNVPLKCYSVLDAIELQLSR